MRRNPPHDVAAATSRRLELLGRELAAAGLGPAGQVDPEQADPVIPEDRSDAGPVLVGDPGRHARGRAPTGSSRLRDAVEDRLPDVFAGVLRGRFALRAAHVACLAVLLAATVAVLAWLALRSAPTAVAVPVAHTTRAPAPSAGSLTPATATGAALPTAMPTPLGPGRVTEVVVDVTGKVRRPGIVRLPSGSRVIDAVRRAGGARRGVDLSSLNLARVLLDGEQILVGKPLPPSGARSAGPASSGAAGGPVSLNAADLSQLDTLPGVGPVTAQKIIDWRTEHGAFSSVDELLEVDGIGTKTLADISPHVTL